MDNCLDSEEKIREVVVRKNCVVYFNWCSEFDKFEYYCVFDLYVI